MGLKHSRGAGRAVGAQEPNSGPLSEYVGKARHGLTCASCRSDTIWSRRRLQSLSLLQLPVSSPEARTNCLALSGRSELATVWWTSQCSASAELAPMSESGGAVRLLELASRRSFGRA